jgi:hypothetical protein
VRERRQHQRRSRRSAANRRSQRRGGAALPTPLQFGKCLVDFGGATRSDVPCTEHPLERGHHVFARRQPEDAVDAAVVGGNERCAGEEMLELRVAAVPDAHLHTRDRPAGCIADRSGNHATARHEDADFRPLAGRQRNRCAWPPRPGRPEGGIDVGGLPADHHERTCREASEREPAAIIGDRGPRRRERAAADSDNRPRDRPCIGIGREEDTGNRAGADRRCRGPVSRRRLVPLRRGQWRAQHGRDQNERD